MTESVPEAPKADAKPDDAYFRFGPEERTAYSDAWLPWHTYTRSMPRGYEEGPVADEAQRRLDAIERGEPVKARTASGTRGAVFGSTEEDSPARFLGWADEVDADELFESGSAWGISLRRIPFQET